MNDQISVIIPTYCRAVSTLHTAVQSVKEQSVPVLEIIIIDDNYDISLSKDIVSYCQKNALVYAASENAGAAAARNIGINIAQGSFIAFLDDDDTWLPNKLSMQMPLFSDSSVGLVYSRGYTVKTDNYGNILKKPYATDSYFKEIVRYRDLLEKNYIGTTSQLVTKKSVLLQINGFDESLPSRQDYDLCLRIAKHYRCLGVNEYLFIHNIHSENQITANASVNMKGYQMLFRKYKSDIYQIADAPRKWCYRITRNALHGKAYAVFLKYLFLAVLYNPFKIKETIQKCIAHNN